MKQIALGGKNGKGKALICDDEWFNELSKYNWYDNGNGYPRAHVPHSGRSATTGRYVYVHVLVAGSTGNHDIDHINRNPLDNRSINLRIGSHQSNSFNQNKRKGSSKYKGVSLKKETGKWLAQITHSYRNIYLGVHSSQEEAARAYDKKARELFGKFANLNFTHG